MKESFEVIHEVYANNERQQKIIGLEQKCSRYLRMIQKLEAKIEELQAQAEAEAKVTKKRPRRPQFHEDIWNNIEGGYHSDKNWIKEKCIHCDSEFSHHRRLDRVRSHLCKCSAYIPNVTLEGVSVSVSDSDSDSDSDTH